MHGASLRSGWRSAEYEVFCLGRGFELLEKKRDRLKFWDTKGTAIDIPPRGFGYPNTAGPLGLGVMMGPLRPVRSLAPTTHGR